MNPTNPINATNPTSPMHALITGGMGFISVAECEVLHNNALINIHMAHTAAEMGVPRCGAEEQRSMEAEVNLLCTPAPVLPSSEGWEKLYAERVAMAF
jgi:hypothetical protein